MPREHHAFISYTRQAGAPIAARLRTLLEREALRLWQDATDMRGGDDFRRQIEEAIEASNYVLMVLTPDAFSGDRRVLRDEWLTARRRGCPVKPVFVRDQPVDFASAAVPAWLKKLDCYDLDDPGHLGKLLDDLRAEPSVRPVPHNVEFPPGFVARDRELETLAALLVEPSDAGERTVALAGAGGFGKTTLARAACLHDAVLARFTDGVLWLTVGEQGRSQADLLGALLTQLTIVPRSADAEVLLGQWKEALRTRECLVVLDDIWRSIDAEGVVLHDTPSIFLVTSRVPRVVTNLRARACEVGGMAPEESTALLAAAGPGAAWPTMPLQSLADRAGHWPVLLGLMSAQLRRRLADGYSPSDAIASVQEDLAEFGLEACDMRDAQSRTQAVAATIGASLQYLERLEPGAGERYRELAVFPDDVAIPIAAAGELWGLSPARARRLAESIRDAGLATMDPRQGLALHDVFVEYVRSQVSAAKLVELHARLLAAWPDFRVLPHAYAWRWVGWHCAHAGAIERLCAVLFDVEWLARKLAEAGITSLLADGGRVANAALPESRAASLLSEAIQLSAHVLAVDARQLPSQLAGRLRRGLDERLDGVMLACERETATWSISLRPESLTPVGSPLKRTLRHDHNDHKRRATELPDGRLLSWGESVRLWTSEGEPLAVMRRHQDWIAGARLAQDGRFVSWCFDHPHVCEWSSTGEPLREWFVHSTSDFDGVTPLRDGRLAYRLQFDPTTIHFWSAEDTHQMVMVGHTERVMGVAELRDGRLLSWSSDHTLRIWSRRGEPIATLRGHTGSVYGAQEMRDSQLVSWGEDDTIRMWSATGASTAVLGDHRSGVIGVRCLADGRIVSWGHEHLSDDRYVTWLRFWTATGVMEREHQIQGAREVEDALDLTAGKVLTWGGGDSDLRVWSATGEPLATVRGDARWPQGARRLRDGRLIVFFGDGMLQLWNEAFDVIATVRGSSNEISGVEELKDGRILSFGTEPAVKLWRFEGAVPPVPRIHAEWVLGIVALPDGRLLSWGDETPLIWSADGELLNELRGHRRRVLGVQNLRDGRILSWSAGNSPDEAGRFDTFRAWSSTGEPLGHWGGSDGDVEGVLELDDGMLCSFTESGGIALWSASGLLQAKCHGGGSIYGVVPLDGGLFVSCPTDGGLRYWCEDAGSLTELHVVREEADESRVLTNGRVVARHEQYIEVGRNYARLYLPADQGDQPSEPSSAVRDRIQQQLIGADEYFYRSPTVLEDGRILVSNTSTTQNTSVWLFDVTGALIQTFPIVDLVRLGELTLPNGSLLFWYIDNSVRFFSTKSATMSTLFLDYAVTVAIATPKGIVIGDRGGQIMLLNLN